MKKITLVLLLTQVNLIILPIIRSPNSLESDGSFTRYYDTASAMLVYYQPLSLQVEIPPEYIVHFGGLCLISYLELFEYQGGCTSSSDENGKPASQIRSRYFALQ